MWRYDYHRSGYTSYPLAEDLFLQWQVNYSKREPVWDDPLNQDLMQFDKVFEPIVSENKLFVGFNDQDKVVALDLSSGKELWNFYADGPVRLPMAVYSKSLLFTSDDGYCYCLNVDSGKLKWKRLLAPTKNKLLGNKRLISMWPARGGVVLKNNIVYTAASIFPLMGTFIYALDADSGDIIWKNEGSGSNYILQPHRSPAFAYVAPQGPFTISGNKLLVAGGRSVPAAYDLETGREVYYELASSGKTGGAFTFANDKVFFNHHRERVTWMYDSESGSKISAAGEYPVIEGDTFYFSGKHIWAAKVGENNMLDTLWISDIAATNDLIKAGDCLYAADSSGIKAVKVMPGNIPEVIWSFATEKNVVRLVAANEKLIAVSDDGSILTFGSAPVESVKVYEAKKMDSKAASRKGKEILQTTGITEGYCLILGGDDAQLLETFLHESNLNLVVYERDQKRVQYLREFFDNKGFNAERISFLNFENEFPDLPKYFSSLTVVNDSWYLQEEDTDNLSRLFETSRPYGGKILFNVSRKEQQKLLSQYEKLNLEGLDASGRDGLVTITRLGQLPGASPWTHNNGDIANTIKSNDKLVRAPLGILWFGGNSNMDVLPRHGHGPGEQVIDGRLIIQGINSISARDVYTGRVLWKREFEKLLDDNWMVYFDETYDEENPLDTKYNQVHLPGANARGTNFIATKEYVYLIEGSKCNVLDIRNGETISVFTPAKEETQELGYIGVYENLLILGVNFTEYTGLEEDSIRIKKPKFTDYNLTASQKLIILDRYTGKEIWQIDANHGFIHNSVIVGDGILFCLDKLPQYLETKMKRRGEPLPESIRLLYLDVKTGNKILEQSDDVFGTWLGYSSEYKLLLQSTRPSRDMLHGELGTRMIAYDVCTNKKIWDKQINYSNPPIIHNDKIYTNGEGFMLLTGEPFIETDPITGDSLKWNFKREYGCGYVAASEYLLTFRSASAGFVNLETNEGTGSLGGWKPGCSTNLIAADGVLNSPDYTRTCQCAYQNQTSLALVNMPWMSYWTNSNYQWSGKPIMQLGLNFNAPGDRSSDENTLWLEFPYVSGRAPGIPVTIDTIGITKIRKEPFSVISEKTPWVCASAIGGIQNIEINLVDDDFAPETTYTVKMYFSELEDKQPGERVFDISIQNEKVTANFDIVAEAGKPDKEVKMVYHGVKAGKSIKVKLSPKAGNTIISGIELIRENFSLN